MQPETIRQTVRLFEDCSRRRPGASPRQGARRRQPGRNGSWTVLVELRSSRADRGTNQAPSPTALLLSALAGCAVVFIRDTLAPQLGVRVDAVEATAQCEADARGLLGMAGAEPDLQNIRLDIRVQSPDDESDVQKVYEAWRERCPIYLALTKAMDVSLNTETPRT